MSIDTLSLKEVFGIMKTCRKLGVTRISYRGFEADFEDETPHSGRKASRKVSPATLEHLDSKTLEALNLARKQDELALLAIEDPYAYEKHMLSEDAAQDSEQDD